VPVRFHGHNDLGLATANALAAVVGGARGLDVTVNGLGDRAGNTSLEQAAMLLELRGWSTGVDTTRLGALSALVARSSGIPVSKLAPVVGAFAFAHRSPRHLDVPAEFEAFTPSRAGAVRRLDRTARSVGPSRRAGSR
jgi:isopropylmalate/homocitrate/citramalate synthase